MLLIVYIAPPLLEKDCYNLDKLMFTRQEEHKRLRNKLSRTTKISIQLKVTNGASQASSNAISVFDGSGCIGSVDLDPDF
jgi:hypothetical protein